MINRRKFIEMMTFFPAAFAMGNILTDRHVYRAAVLGCGQYGQKRIFDCMTLGRKNQLKIQLVAVCDLSPARMHEALDVAMRSAGDSQAGLSKMIHEYVDYRILLEKEGRNLDVVFVCTPDFCHQEQVVACFEHGLHVFCELPLANNLESARMIAKAVSEKSLALWSEWDFDRNLPYQYIRDNWMGAEKLLGDIKYMRANVPSPAECQCMRHSPQEIDMIAKQLLQQGWCKEIDVKRAGYASPYELKYWKRFRKFGLGYVLQSIWNQCGMFVDVLDGVPRKVIVHTRPDESCGYPLTSCFQFDCHTGCVLAESQVFGSRQYLDMYTETSMAHVASPRGSFFALGRFSKSEHISQCEYDWLLQKCSSCQKQGLLGDRLDISTRTQVDLIEGTALQKDGADSTQSKLEAMERDLERYNGDEDSWLLPKKIVEKSQQFRQTAGENTIVTFLKSLTNPEARTRLLRKVLAVQTLVEGTEIARQRGGVHVFSNEINS